MPFRFFRIAAAGFAVGMATHMALLAAAAQDPSQPGAYCKLPEEGEIPECLAPAQQRYPEFFADLEDGELSDSEAARLEAAVAAGAGSDDSYEALSTLSYGYFMLARTAAAQPASERPAVSRRLERWNEILLRAYSENEADPNYRAAVREAAVDLRARAPKLRLRCTNEHGEPAQCESTEAVLRNIDAARQSRGIRGALGRLLDSILGGGDS